MDDKADIMASKKGASEEQKMRRAVTGMQIKVNRAFKSSYMVIVRLQTNSRKP